MPLSAKLRRQGRRLLNQQCWNWGRDVLRAEGNLLLEAGFTKQRPPEGETGATRYLAETPEGGRFVLWGFGLFFGATESGGVYLNRFDFKPRWIPVDAVERPIWKPDLVPTGRTPPSVEAPLELAAAAALRIADYEHWVLALCGLEYREGVLREWDQARETLPPQELPSRWRELADQLGAVAATKRRPPRASVDARSPEDPVR